MRLLLLFSGAVLLCGCPSGWPEEERAVLQAECSSGGMKAGGRGDKERQVCECMLEKLPKRLDFPRYKAWRDAPGTGQQRDPAVTQVVGNVSKECALGRE